MAVVTQKTIADRLGVHSTTVSMALRGVESIPPATRRRIVEVAREMGYQPNAMARHLRYSRSRMIGIIANVQLGEMMLRRITLATQALQDRGYEVMLYSPRFDEKGMERTFNSLASHRIEGVISAAGGWNTIPNVVEDWRRRDWPAVFLMPYQPFSTLNLIDTDRVAGYHDSVKYLASLGHRDIAILQQTEEKWTDVRTTTRMEGYKAGLAARNLPFHPNRVLSCDLDDQAQVAQAMERLVALKPRPTALLACSDLDAVWSIRHLLRLGLQVPRDISVIGFDNSAIAEASMVPLTTMAQPVEEIAELTVKQLMAIIGEQKPRKFDPILRPPRLIVRESTGPACGGDNQGD